jgi:hypothetical protein
MLPLDPGGVSDMEERRNEVKKLLYLIGIKNVIG